jgi:hypothetical protein
MTTVRALLSAPMYGEAATVTLTAGAADADFPVSNLASPREPRRLFKASASGAISIRAVLPAAQPVAFVCLTDHNAINAATYRVRCWSDAAATALLDDSGTLAFAIGADAQFRKNTPYALPAAVAARAVTVDLSDIGTAWKIGALVISGALWFDAVSKREVGVIGGDAVAPRAGPAQHATRQFSPRVVTLGRDNRTYGGEGFSVLDLMRDRGTADPFVVVLAYDEPASWERGVILARFRTPAPVRRVENDLVDYELPMIEHLE